MQIDRVVTRAVAIGPKERQEDRNVAFGFRGRGFQAYVIGVFDGHGESAAAAEYCRRETETYPWPSEIADSEGLLRSLVTRLVNGTDRFRCGTTLSLALIVKRKHAGTTVSVAILGDSPVVVYDGAGSLHVGPHHNVRTNPDDRRAVHDRGGIIEFGSVRAVSGGYGLQLSRALGDRELGRILSREPDIYTIDDPHWILVASDGLFDPGRAPFDELVAFAGIGATAEDLMKWALQARLHDNTTALVWQSLDVHGQRDKE